MRLLEKGFFWVEKGWIVCFENLNKLLAKKKKREFKYKGAPRYPIVDFINKAVSTAERMSCEIVTGEDIDQVGQPLDLGLPLAELVGVVEVGEIAACQTRVGIDQRLDDLSVDAVADVAFAL